MKTIEEIDAEIARLNEERARIEAKDDEYAKAAHVADVEACGGHPMPWADLGEQSRKGYRAAARAVLALHASEGAKKNTVLSPQGQERTQAGEAPATSPAPVGWTEEQRDAAITVLSWWADTPCDLYAPKVSSVCAAIAAIAPRFVAEIELPIPSEDTVRSYRAKCAATLRALGLRVRGAT